MTKACAWCGDPFVGPPSQRFCCPAHRVSGWRQSGGRLKLLRDTRTTAAAPPSSDLEGWPRCEVCARIMVGRRADARTCGKRCRVARHRGAAPWSLAEVYSGPGRCCGVVVWSFRPPNDEGPGIVSCTRCGGISQGWPRRRPWEPSLDVDAAELRALAAANLLPPDEDEDVYPDAQALQM